MNWLFTYQIIASPVAVGLVVAASYLLGHQGGKHSGVKLTARYIASRLKAGCIEARGEGYVVQKIEGEYQSDHDLTTYLKNYTIITDVVPK